MTIDDHGWLANARRVLSPNCNARPEAEPPSLLVVHNISLPPGEFGGGFIEQFFTNDLDPDQHPYFQQISDLQVSAHLLIDRKGEITQFVPFEQRAWHAGVSSFHGREACNDYSIGIELEGCDELPYTRQQYQALVRVAKELMLKYPLITEDRITGHSDIAPGRKTDPGPAFDWGHFRNSLG